MSVFCSPFCVYFIYGFYRFVLIALYDFSFQLFRCLDYRAVFEIYVVLTISFDISISYLFVLMI